MLLIWHLTKALVLLALSQMQVRAYPGRAEHVNGQKKCKVCGEMRPLGEYATHKTTWDRLHQTCRRCSSQRVVAQRKAHRDSDPEGYRKHHSARIRKSRYGITQEDYEAMLVAQGGGCAICGSPNPRNGNRKDLVVDHDHKTGEVRGLLCDPCNNGLGRFRDDPSLLRRAAEYLLTPVMVPVLAALVLGRFMLALRTTAGRDWQARVMGDTSSNGSGAYAPATYVGLTADGTAPASGDVTLTGEIVGGTLARAQATYAHTGGTATYTLTKTFTSDQTVTVRKIGVFNAAANGTLCFESALNADASLVSGDSLQVTVTVTL